MKLFVVTDDGGNKCVVKMNHGLIKYEADERFDIDGLIEDLSRVGAPIIDMAEVKEQLEFVGGDLVDGILITDQRTGEKIEILLDPVFGSMGKSWLILSA